MIIIKCFLIIILVQVSLSCVKNRHFTRTCGYVYNASYSYVIFKCTDVTCKYFSQVKEVYDPLNLNIDFSLTDFFDKSIYGCGINEQINEQFKSYAGNKVYILKLNKLSATGTTATTISGGCNQCDGQCLENQHICDGVIDCSDGSDEKNCFPCKGEDEYICENLKCIKLVERCNGLQDCGDGSDEKNCADEGKPSCNQCDGQCLEDLRICDGVIDCSDGSDEHNCLPCNGADDYQCENLRCIKLVERCNGLQDCGDGSDEENCGDEGEPNKIVWLMIGGACGVLISGTIVGVAKLYFKYKAKRRSGDIVQVNDPSPDDYYKNINAIVYAKRTSGDKVQVNDPVPDDDDQNIYADVYEDRLRLERLAREARERKAAEK